MLSVTGLHKKYGTLPVLDDVSFSLRDGEKLAIIGPSGSGKSTCLRAINYLEPPTSGEIKLDGEWLGRTAKGRPMSAHELAPQRARIGMVFQHFHLWPHLSVRENIALQQRKMQGLSRADADDQANMMLARVCPQEKADAFPGHLSRGQQRVAIARALAQRPRLILFDEPTSALDPALVGEVLAVIREIAEQGSAMVLVTHEIAFARNVADNVIFMDDGRIVEQGRRPTQVFEAPRAPRLQKFLSLVAPAVGQ